MLELATVIVIIGILTVMAIPVVGAAVGRMEKAKCIGNLRSIHVATSLYIRDNQHWPQLTTATYGNAPAAQAWIDTMRPYGLEQNNWICPSVQKALRSPDFTQPDQTRVDYYATTFNTKPDAPFSHPRQPWYAECADVHGNGQEILFPDGHVEEAGELIRNAGAAPTAPSTGSSP